jgi:hypothetical protein
MATYIEIIKDSECSIRLDQAGIKMTHQIGGDLLAVYFQTLMS